MFKRAIIEAFHWNYKFYLSSFSASVGTFFFFEKNFGFTIFRSLRYGVALFVLSFIIRTVYNYILKACFQSKTHFISKIFDYSLYGLKKCDVKLKISARISQTIMSISC